MKNNAPIIRRVVPKKEQWTLSIVLMSLFGISIWGIFLLAQETIDWKGSWHNLLYYGRILFLQPKRSEHLPFGELMYSLGISFALSILTTLGAAVIAFRKPASVKDTRFLQIVNKDRANDKCIYLPALRTVRRIAGAEGSKSFMGTDADYDDLETRKIEQDTHTLLGEETVDSYQCWKVESVPVDPKSSRYSKKIAYIDKGTSVPVKAEMYDKKGKLLKVLHVETLEQKQNYWIPMKSKLTNVQTNHSTVLEILKIEIDKPINDQLFTQNFLNTGRL